MLRRSPVALLFALVLLVSACGSKSHNPSAARSTSSSASSASDSSAPPDPVARIPDVVQALQPAVVTILTSSGLGSGIVYKADGTVITDEHVVSGQSNVDVAFADGKHAAGRVLATDPSVDLAVVKVDRTNLPVAPFQQTLPRVGEVAIAIGSPLGFSETVTSGIVSGVHRSLPGSAQSAGPLVDLLQTDAPISPGNSGGALVNANGEVIGVNEAYIPPTAGAVAIGFATPAASAVNVADQLLKNGRAVHAYLGVQPADITPQVAQQLGISQTSGALVEDVGPGSPAAQAGVQPGDIIISIADKPVNSAEDLLTTLRQLSPGDKVPLVVVRAGQQQAVSVTLGDRPTS